MKVRVLFAIFVLPIVAPAGSEVRGVERPLELRDGDRVVFLGNTLIERAQTYGYIETLLTVSGPKRNVTFRNLGWSGDNVFGHSRAVFDPAAAGFGKMRKQVIDAKPTVLVVGYGSNAAYSGKEGLASFLTGYNRLLDTLGETGARIVLLSPIRIEAKGAPLPDPARQNANLEIYVKAIGELAARRSLLYVNLFKRLRAGESGNALTDNGIHLNAHGYRAAAAAVADALGLGVENTVVKLGTSATGSRALSFTNAEIKDLGGDGFGVSFRMTRSVLPGYAGGDVAVEMLSVSGLLPGSYALQVDGNEVVQATAAAWKAGVALERGPDFDQVEKIRRLSVEKNFFYFHRYRPANWPYIYGFRKHEQGNNAVEIPLFDPLITGKEAKIAALRQPVTRRYEIARVKGGAK